MQIPSLRILDTPSGQVRLFSAFYDEVHQTSSYLAGSNNAPDTVETERKAREARASFLRACPTVLACPSSGSEAVIPVTVSAHHVTHGVCG